MTTATPCLIKAPSDNQLSYEAAVGENPANGPTYSGRNKRSVSDHTKYWMPGRTLKIAISDYQDGGFDIVKNAIEKWLPYVNLKFEFIELPDNDELYEGDIRIYLTQLANRIAYSTIGTDALTVPAYLHTMQLGRTTPLPVMNQLSSTSSGTPSDFSMSTNTRRQYSLE